MAASPRNRLSGYGAGAALLLLLAACGPRDHQPVEDADMVNAADATANEAAADERMDELEQDQNRVGAMQPGITEPTQPLGSVRPTEHQTGIRPLDIPNEQASDAERKQ